MPAGPGVRCRAVPTPTAAPSPSADPPPAADPAPAADLPVLAEVVRSGFVEGHHRGSVVVLGPDGAVQAAYGEVSAPMLPRSANKPAQAAGMLGAGLDVDGPALAVAAASHSGEPYHLAAVRQLLAGAGLSTADLQTPPDWPLDEATARDWVRAGGSPERIAMNCSGKHAAMLATCVAAGWPTATYRDPGHPLQQHLRRVLGDLAGEPVAVTAVDGCGAPLFAISLTGLARAARALVLVEPGTPQRRVADAMRAHPEYVGGTARDVTALMRGVPGLLVKDGAEGVCVAATGDGGAVAVKVDDGSGRARMPVLVAGLRRLGVDGPALAGLAATPVLGGGAPVGAVRVVPPLSR